MDQAKKIIYVQSGRSGSQAKKLVFNAAARCGKDVSMEDLEWYLKNQTMEQNLEAISNHEAIKMDTDAICKHYGVDPNAKVKTLFTYDPRKWYGPLHRYNRLIAIRNNRVELGLRLSYGK